MKIHFLWFIVLAAALAGCAEDRSQPSYHQSLTSPGGIFSTLPPTVQNSVRAQAGMAEINHIYRNRSEDGTIFEFYFKNPEIFPPLYVTSDGSVLTPDLRVAVGASRDSVTASTGSAASGLRLGDLPPNVVRTIRSQAPTSEVDSVHRITDGPDTYYEVFFKDPNHAKLVVTDDGRVVR